MPHVYTEHCASRSNCCNGFYSFLRLRSPFFPLLRKRLHLVFSPHLVNSIYRAKSGTESLFSNPCDNHDGIGNLSGRIPDSLSGRPDNEDATSFTGNPDIRVPEGLKSEDALRAGGAFDGEDA
ncbi:hypothetical protein NDU88_002591 [Pleurodeles waltl]|uniref:Uncharacterized protein n=1 Tax=Pleurodeles waltl TaxID=8319 RepID=A0AAV7PBA8_PLEWA|nr:hypothetical protein NDU88_002591 [Pleurodeles waltl]